MQEITDNAVPVTTNEAIRNENIQRYGGKISNTNIEILRIHEDYVTATTTTTTFTLMLLNGLLVLGAPNFRNRWKKYQQKNYLFF